MKNAQLVDPLVNTLRDLVAEAEGNNLLEEAATLAEAGLDIIWMAEMRDAKLLHLLTGRESGPTDQDGRGDTQERI